jgi:hypothetical protein
MAAGVLAGAVAAVPGLMNGGEPGSPPAAAAKPEGKLAEVVPPNIVITPDQVKEFFGGKPAKLLLSVQYDSKTLPGQEKPASVFRHYLLDFGVQPFTPVPVTDAVWPSGYGDDEAFISPDGTRLVYQDADGMYVCEFKPGGPGRKKIASETAGHTPRWWVHPKTGDEYIIYIRPEPKIQGKSGFGKGKTCLQQVKKGGCEPVGGEKILVKEYTFNGGRSLDGKYICSSHFGWAIAELKPDAVEDAFVKLLKTGKSDRCNPSISQDPAHPEWWLWCDPSHKWMYFNPHLEDPKWGDGSQDEREKAMREKEAIPAPPKTGRLDHAEWSTHPDFITVTNPGGTTSTYVWSWPLKKWVTVAQRKTSDNKLTRLPTHLWVGK